MKTYRKILVPLDGSELAARALDDAAAIASPDTEVVLLRVIPLDELGAITPDTPLPLDFPTIERELRQEATAYLEQAAQRLPIPTRIVVERGDPARVILEHLNGVDLLVMTSHGRSGFRRWLHGSVARKVLRHAPCPVLLIQCRSARDAHPVQLTPGGVELA